MKDDDFLRELAEFSDEELETALSQLPESVVDSLLVTIDRQGNQLSQPFGPLEQAMDIDPNYRDRPHLRYLSERLRQATLDVEAGQSRFMLVSMPPRTGKSQLTSVYFPLWLLRRHPDWEIGMISHSDTLAISWTREIRRIIEEQPEMGVKIARDTRAASRWDTVTGGKVTARSAPGQSITGLGFKVLLVDDAVRDFATAHSPKARTALWDWWTVNASTRLEPPSLVVMVGTRWHEDDLLGRLTSDEYEGDPDQWEEIRFPAIADTASDILGRKEGEPLISPLMDETKEEAVARWSTIRSTVGTYGWSALYQQRPAPAKGAIFDAEWWRFWTSDPDKATDDDRIRYLDPSTLTGGQWLDSWDLTFKGDAEGDYVVGQRWVRHQANRYLVAQQRGRWSFTQTLEKMLWWAQPESPWGKLVHLRIVEAAANGEAIMDVLREKVSGIKPIYPKTSKEARARAITPEIESGNVYLPLPSDPGMDWVNDYLSEFRNFPHDIHDDQVDTTTQALMELRDPGRGSVTVPGRGSRSRSISRNLAQAALSDLNRRRS